MPICDLEFIKSVTPGNYSFPIKVIEAFLKETPLKIEKLNDAIENQQWDLTYELTHNIKPGVLMLGMPQKNLDAILKILSYTKENRKLDEINGLYKTFIENIDSIYKDLEESLKVLKNS